LSNKIKILGDKIAEARFKRKFLPKISKSLISNPNIAAQICRHAEMELYVILLVLRLGPLIKVCGKN
jgi:hypothetical protein